MAERPAVKICGLCRRQDVLVADALGVEYLGVVVTGGFSRSVTPSDAERILEGVEATRVAVLVDESVDAVAAAAATVDAGVIQLHGAEPPDAVLELRSRGSWRIWKAVKARAPDDLLRTLDHFGGVIDGLLLEGWKEGVMGGGGARLDLEVFATLRAAVPADIDLILAGGLTPESVAGAVARISPDVVDVSSGVEVRVREKDPQRVRDFVRQSREDIVLPHDPNPISRGDTPS